MIVDIIVLAVFKGEGVYKITSILSILKKLKWYVPITSSPRAQPEVALFWCQMKVHIFILYPQNFTKRSKSGERLLLLQ